MATDLNVELEKKRKLKIKTPNDWKVIFVNDDTTPMDFVISALTTIFHHGPEAAYDIMMQIHEEGSGVAGVYTFEIAEAKSVETTDMARSNGFPLLVKIEEEV